jgi:hypothetical protein
MTDVIFLPGINALLKDLEIFAAGRPSSGYSVDDEIRGVDAAADQAGQGSSASTGIQQVLRARWPTRSPARDACCPSPWTSQPPTSRRSTGLTPPASLGRGRRWLRESRRRLHPAACHQNG